MIRSFPKEKTKKRKISRTGLIKKLDAVFSLYIRLRDVDSNGYGKCITSGEFVHFKDADCGHFISRNNMATRYHEKNCNLQGRKDNRFLSGRQFEHGLAIDRKWGKGTAELLLVKSKAPIKFHEFELEAMYNHYRNLVNQLKKEKNIV